MSKISRVNVSTATSVVRDDGYGNRIAEVEMQLPNNLVNVEGARGARMMVSKLKTSLACLPACSFPVSYVSKNILRTKFKVMTIPIKGMMGVDGTSYNFFGVNETPAYFKPADQLHFSYVLVSPEHVSDPAYEDEARVEAMRGYHNCNRITDFLQLLSKSVSENILANCKNDVGSTQSNPGYLSFELESDNTISMNLIPRLSTVQPYPAHSIFRFTTGGVQFRLLTNRKNGMYQYEENEQYVIGVNEELRDKLPTLPWRRYQLRPEFGNWDEKYIYFLASNLANINKVEQLSFWYRGGSDSVNAPILKYQFVESDAITVSDIASLILCMNGADFNNQVLPVNLSRGNLHAAQTTHVPIIDFYFPLWTRPSDMTTEFIVKQDVFSSAAPTNISLELLRERSIRFKMYYVTKRGEMREMVIPKDSILAFQLCIETY